MTNLPRFPITINRQIVKCESKEDRQLLRDAEALAADPGAAKDTSISRLHLMKDVCQRYSRGALQRLVKREIDAVGR